ncbi:MAG: GatB/YqeY domain-containing protein [Candidatus Harrisonbacteria bacterium]|nr:GatB/YqeY domain-containing protein [Candidatus Harrisonbacteria bacterium]
MSLKEKINSDLKTAMKSGDALALNVLRMLVSALHNKGIEKRTKGGSDELTDEEILQVVMSEAKKRKESIEIFSKGNRPDLAAKEKSELEVVQRYLPAQMSREEVEKSVDAILSKLEKKEIGPAMKAVMKELRGKADSGMVSEMVKNKLS